MKHIKPSPCPNCGVALDGATAVDEDGIDYAAKPQPGNPTVCILCNHISVWDKQLRLRNPTPAEMREISKNKVVRQVVAGVALVRAMRKAIN